MTLKHRNISLLALVFCFIVCSVSAIALSVNSFTAKATESTVKTSMSVTLKDDVTVNCCASGIADTYTEAQMKFTYRGNEYVENATVENGNAFFKFNKITPQYFTEEVTAQLLLGGIETGDVQNFSIKSYCLSLLNGTAESLNISEEKFQALKPLVVDLLYYGEETQNYLQINTGDLATADLNEDQKALKTEYEELVETDLSFDAPTAQTDIAWTQAGLRFDYNVSLYVKFALKNAPTGEVRVKFAKGENAPESIVAVQDETLSGYTVYKATFTNISATEFDKVITATVFDGETQVGTPLTYSVKSFAYSKQSDATLGGLAKAVYNYGKSALSYSNVVGVESVELPETITVYDVYQDVAPEISGFNLTVNYDNGTSDEVDVALAQTDVEIITEETTRITLTYNGASVSLPVNVIAHTGIGALEGWYKSYYKDGEKFNKGGLKIGYTYPDGAIKGDLAYTVDTETVLNASTKSVQVASGDYTVDLPVNVVSANSSIIIEAEHGVQANGMETVTSGGTVSAASNASYLRNFKKDSTVTFSVYSQVASVASIRFYLASHEDLFSGSDTTFALNPSEYLTVSLNGTQIPFGKYDILPATTSTNVATRLCNWYVVTFDGVSLNAGKNELVFKVLEDLSNSNPSNLHSTAFDKIEVLYATESATPGIAVNYSGTEVVYEAENTHFVNIEVSKKSYGVNSGLYNYMGGSDPGFLKDLKSGGLITFHVNSSIADTVKLYMHASTTQGSDVALADLITGITINGRTADLALTGSYSANDKSVAAMATFSGLEVASLLLDEGNNEIVIKFNASSSVFVDKFTIQPAVIDESTPLIYQAEDCELTGIARVVKAEGASSGLFSYMEAAGDTDPGFIKDFSAGGMLKLVFNSATAKKVKISIWGSSTSNASINLSTVVSDMKLNDASVMPTDGVMFPAWGSITGAQAMANWQEYVVGEFDAVAGNNTFIITFNGTSNAFIDRLVVASVTE